MIEATLTMMATLVVAIVWIIRQEITIRTTNKRLGIVDKRLHSAKLTLTDARREVDGCLEENQLLKTIITDVAKGEAHVWIEDGEVRATRTAHRETPVH